MSLSERRHEATWMGYLDVTENSSLEEFQCEVLTHPVFLVQSAPEYAREQAGEEVL